MWDTYKVPSLSLMIKGPDSTWKQNKVHENWLTALPKLIKADKVL